MVKKKIMFVQIRSYDTFSGGDGLYIDRLRDYCAGMRHEIRTIVANPSLDRPRLMIKLVYGNHAYNNTVMRGGFNILGVRLILSFDLLKNTLSYIQGRLASKLANFTKPLSSLDRQPTARELAWIDHQIEQWRPDHIVLCFEAAKISSLENDGMRSVLHLFGFLDAHKYDLAIDKASDEMAAASPSFFHASSRGKISVAIGTSSRDEWWLLKNRYDHLRPYYIGIGLESNFNSSEQKDDIALFVGNKTSVNQNSVRYFIENIWPLVRQVKPNAKFILVGRICHWFDSNPGAGIHSIGEVDDLSEHYFSAKVVVAPLIEGSAGVKTKVAEAISFGKPVVTTSIGVDRHDPQQLDRAGYVADDPQIFASHVIELFDNPSLLAEKELGARLTFMDLFSKRAAYKDFEDWLSWTGKAPLTQEGLYNSPIAQ